MFKWNIFKRKTLSSNFLYGKYLTTHKKRWESVLQSIQKKAIQVADGGGTQIVIKQELLNVVYNQKRKQEDILDDVKKSFKGCRCFYEEDIMSNLNIHVDWSKN